MMHRGQSAAVKAHDEACVDLLRQWAADTPLPEHLEVWTTDYLQRIETSVVRTQEPAMVHTHQLIREFLAHTTNPLLVEAYCRIEYKLNSMMCMMQEDGYGDEKLWATQMFADLNYSTTALMGWVRMVNAYLEDPRDIGTADFKGLKAYYTTASASYAGRLNLFIRDLRTQPVSCAALVKQASLMRARTPLPVEDFEALWGWHKGLLRLQTLSVVGS